MENQMPLRYCLYARKSSEQDERQAMSIDSQLAEMRALAERDGLNVVCELQESHSAKCEMGWRPGVAPLGYINRSFGGVSDIIPDPDRAEIIVEMFHKASQGWSGRRLKGWLDEQGVTTRNGKAVPVSSVLAMLINPFYYGEFQYPEGPGNPWYKGAHKPLVSRELWDEVQQSRGVNKGIWGSKQFAFRGLLKCGRCGAEVTAQEKIKLLKKTGVHKRFVLSLIHI